MIASKKDHLGQPCGPAWVEDRVAESLKLTVDISLVKTPVPPVTLKKPFKEVVIPTKKVP